METNIILIDNYQLFREELKKILNFEEEFYVLGEGDDLTDVPHLVERYNPDIVLMDINLSQISILEPLTDITRQFPDTKMVILSVYEDKSYVTQAFRRGVQGYLLKEMDSNSLIDAIKVVQEGGTYVHPQVTHHLVEECRRLSERTDVDYKPSHSLTRREWEVLEQMVNGNSSNRAIGDSLFLSEKTVKNHVFKILLKMEVKDRTQAVVKAIKSGWVEVN